ncbi:MAG: thioredoxin family protein [Myxococcales bacterium]|nr:thioredoxin family protein [Myxococcales bacterium]
MARLAHISLQLRLQRWAAIVFALVTFGTTGAATAQCVSCGNPAFASGDNDLSRTMAKSGDDKGFRIRAGLGYGWLTSNAYFEGNEETVNFDNFSMTMHLLNLTAAVEAPWGSSMSMVLPWARLDNQRRFGGGVDKGFGDLELRLRQDVSQLWGGSGPKVVLSAGVVAPTGVYVERDSTDATVFSDTGLGGGFGGGGWGEEETDDASAEVTNDTGRYLSVGRGSWWLLADLEAFGSVNARIGYYAAINTRFALNYAPDEFGWGPEVRNTVGINGVVIEGRLNASLMGEYQWRGRSTEVLYGERENFLNGGGDFVTVMPTLQVVLGDRFGLSVSGRIPVHRDVVGVQVVANPSVWVTLSGTFGVGGGAAFAGATAGASATTTPAKEAAPGTREAAPAPKGAAPGTKGMFVKNKATAESLKAAENATKVGEKPKYPEIAALLVPGKTTVVDYWASWCKPCLKLDKVVHAYEQTQPANVVFKKFDATAWRKAEWLKYLPDAPTLPVLDVYGPDGRLQARLSGADAFAFRDRMPK